MPPTLEFDDLATTVDDPAERISRLERQNAELARRLGDLVAPAPPAEETQDEKAARIGQLYGPARQMAGPVNETAGPFRKPTHAPRIERSTPTVVVEDRGWCRVEKETGDGFIALARGQIQRQYG